jgi:hypothetical protein
MSKSDSFNFFALLKHGGSLSVRRIHVEKKLQDDLTTEFLAQRSALVSSDVDVVPFDGSMVAEESEVHSIAAFDLPTDVSQAVSDPTSVDALDSGNPDVMDSLRSIFAGRIANGEPHIILQSFDRRRAFAASRFTLFAEETTFARLEKPVLTLDTRAAAVYEGGALIFRSFVEARRIFDLSKHYREATSMELHAFATHPRIACADPAGFVETSNAWVRRKIAVLAESKLLDVLDLKDVELMAKKYKVGLSVAEGRLELPSDKKALREVLRFLDENYFTSDLTGTQYLAKSKGRLK